MTLITGRVRPSAAIKDHRRRADGKFEPEHPAPVHPNRESDSVGQSPPGLGARRRREASGTQLTHFYHIHKSQLQFFAGIVFLASPRPVMLSTRAMAAGMPAGQGILTPLRHARAGQTPREREKQHQFKMYFDCRVPCGLGTSFTPCGRSGAEPKNGDVLKPRTDSWRLWKPPAPCTNSSLGGL